MPCGTAWLWSLACHARESDGIVTHTGRKRIINLSTFAGEKKVRVLRYIILYFGGIDSKVTDAGCKLVSFGTRCFKYTYLHHSWVAQRQSGTLLKSWSGVRSSPQEHISLVYEKF